MIRNLMEGARGEIVALPVSRNTGNKVPDETRPYTAFEVLTNFFGEDMKLVLGNYINMELETIQDKGALKNASSARLLSYYYKKKKAQKEADDDVNEGMEYGETYHTDDDDEEYVIEDYNYESSEADDESEE
ncbi:hypothetical protein [Lactonifactor sp. BIOML-A7]|nr:hypothetical protein [Lactonifactor sp. BIOML-A7]